jgi:hypothetical protein
MLLFPMVHAYLSPFPYCIDVFVWNAAYLRIQHQS